MLKENEITLDAADNIPVGSLDKNELTVNSNSKPFRLLEVPRVAYANSISPSDGPVMKKGAGRRNRKGWTRLWRWGRQTRDVKWLKTPCWRIRRVGKSRESRKQPSDMVDFGLSLMGTSDSCSQRTSG